MARIAQLREAQATITLCKKDGRKKYGVDALGEIKAGTRFTYLPGNYEKHDPARVSFISGRRYDGAIDSDAAARIEALSIEQEPANFAEVLAMRGYSGYEIFGDRVLSELIAQGKVTLADATAVLDQCLAKED